MSELCCPGNGLPGSSSCFCMNGLVGARCAWVAGASKGCSNVKREPCSAGQQVHRRVTMLLPSHMVASTEAMLWSEPDTWALLLRCCITAP